MALSGVLETFIWYPVSLKWPNLVERKSGAGIVTLNVCSTGTDIIKMYLINNNVGREMSQAYD